MSARYRFVPWVRDGAASAVQTPDTLGGGLPARPTLPVALTVNSRPEVQLQLGLYGPGDVTGFDTRTVLRTDPPDLARGVDPSRFPAVELDVPALPWLLTPATGDEQGRLRPWVCLVVVRRQPGVTLQVRGRALPVLTVGAPARPAAELPDLDESWAWAHAQVVASGDTAVGQLLDRGREGTLARLVCPRRLRPDEDYLACLVPAFAAGRRAGLGSPPVPEDDAGLEPAWRVEEDPASVELPVYLHWEFGTGSGGDFESLARRLRGRPVPAGVGTRDLDVADPGLGLPDGGVLPMQGALRAPGPDAMAAVPAALVSALTDILNTPARLREAAGQDEPVVAPPIYGGWQAVQQRLDDASPRWLREANLDPRLRSAAGLGTLVVQDQQENLMASAWEQLGSPGRGRAVLVRRDLARAVLTRLHAALSVVPAETFLLVTGPIHAKVRLERPGLVLAAGSATADEAPRTVREQIRRSRLPVSVVSGGFRKTLRPRGPVVRRAVGGRPTPVATSGGRGGGVRADLLDRLAQPLERPSLATGAVASPATVDSTVIDRRVRGLVVLSTMIAESSRFSAAVREVTAHLADAVGERPVRREPRIALDKFQAVLLDTIRPSATLPPSVVPTRDGQTRETTAQPVVAAALPGPRFPQAMYEPLRDLAPDLMLPGLDAIPQDSVTLLETNPPFIESYMLGLNHEMSRELLWREYPSHLRATSFDRFWGGRTGMQDVHEWRAADAVGSHVAAGSGEDQLVLLVRGDLLGRYPDTSVYAMPAPPPGAPFSPGVGGVAPLFRAAVAHDTVVVGFDLTLDRVRGGDGGRGWYFVLEEPVGRPRFGLDEPTAFGRDPDDIGSWDDVTWGDTVQTEQELEDLGHVPVRGRLAGRSIGPLRWGLNAGHMAAISLQRPVRVLFHAVDLLPADGQEDDP